jgi:dethiobiotin synthetase
VKYFVTAIDTDSGKTLVSAILCQALGADYWKPVQAGLPRDTDTITLLSPGTITHPETYLLNTPASPHAAAAIDGITLRLDDFKLPATSRPLVIEGAGGCLVPLSDTLFVVDLITHFQAEAVLVADLYLGSINHTLLTFEGLKKRGVRIKGIIFNGNHNSESERIILLHTGLPCLLHIDRENSVTPDIVKQYAHQLKLTWK